MALGTAESRGEESFDQLPGERIAQHPAAQADQVHIVVFDPLARGIRFMDQTCPNSRHFVRDDARADAAAADGDAALHLPRATARPSGTTKSG